MPVKRLPLTGTYNTRPVTLVASGTTSIVGIAIVGMAIVGSTNVGITKDHRLLNCCQITQTDETAQTKRIEVVKRPGFPAFQTPAAGSIGNAIHVWTGQGLGTKVMSCFGGTNSTLYDGTTSKGAITGKATSITETLIGGVATLTIPSTDSTAWYFPDAGVLTKIVDVDYPGNAGRTMTGPIVHMDGWAFQMDTGCRISNSDINSVVSWTAANFVTANSIPDVGVAAWRLGQFIIAFCKEHFEVYRNAGLTAASPLARIEEKAQLIGCVSADAIASIRDTVYFAGSTKGANLSILKYSGGAAVPISTPEIEAQLVIAGPSNISLTAMGFYGRHFIVVMASTVTYAYCVEENKWFEMTGTQLWYKSDGVTVGNTMVNYTISKTSTSGKTFILNPGLITYQDNGVGFTATIQTSKWDAGNSREKFVGRLSIVCDEETSASAMTISCYDDDYQTLQSLGTVDLSDTDPYITQCGSFIRRAHVLTHSANTPMRIEAIEIEYEQSQHG